ncbi:D-serine dehydratase [Lysinibacillus sphaericus]
MENDLKHELFHQYPLLETIKNRETVFWENTKWTKKAKTTLFSNEEVKDAEETLQRFSSYLTIAYPELLHSKGLIESPIQQIAQMKKALRDAQKVLHYAASIKETACKISLGKQ